MLTGDTWYNILKNDTGGAWIKLPNGKLHAIVFGVRADQDIIGMKSALGKHVDDPQHNLKLRFASHLVAAAYLRSAPAHHATRNRLPTAMMS